MKVTRRIIIEEVLEEKIKIVFCLLLQLKSRSARGASHHPIFMGNCTTINQML